MKMYEVGMYTAYGTYFDRQQRKYFLFKKYFKQEIFLAVSNNNSYFKYTFFITMIIHIIGRLGSKQK